MQAQPTNFKKIAFFTYDFKSSINLNKKQNKSIYCIQNKSIVNQKLSNRENQNIVSYDVQNIINELVDKLRKNSTSHFKCSRNTIRSLNKCKKRVIVPQSVESSNRQQIKHRMQENKNKLLKNFIHAQTPKIFKNQENQQSNKKQQCQQKQNDVKMHNNDKKLQKSSQLINSKKSSLKYIEFDYNQNQRQSQRGIAISQTMAYQIKTILKKYIQQEQQYTKHTSSLLKIIRNQKSKIKQYQQIHLRNKDELSQKNKSIQKFKASGKILLKKHQNDINRITRSKILQQINQNSKQISKLSSNLKPISDQKQPNTDQSIKNGTKKIINSQSIGKTIKKAMCIKAYVPTQQIQYLTQICGDTAYLSKYSKNIKSSTSQNFKTANRRQSFQRYNQTASQKKNQNNSNQGISRFKNNTCDDNASLFSNLSNIPAGGGSNRFPNNNSGIIGHTKNFSNVNNLSPSKIQNILISTQNIQKQKQIKRSNTAIELHRKINYENNKNILLRQVVDLQKRKQVIIEQLANNSIKYQECINNLDQQIEMKKGMIIQIQKKRNSNQDSQSSSQLQIQMKDTIEDCNKLIKVNQRISINSNNSKIQIIQIENYDNKQQLNKKSKFCTRLSFKNKQNQQQIN